MEEVNVLNETSSKEVNEFVYIFLIEQQKPAKLKKGTIEKFTKFVQVSAKSVDEAYHKLHLWANNNENHTIQVRKYERLTKIEKIA